MFINKINYLIKMKKKNAKKSRVAFGHIILTYLKTKKINGENNKI